MCFTLIVCVCVSVCDIGHIPLMFIGLALCYFRFGMEMEMEMVDGYGAATVRNQTKPN